MATIEELLRDHPEVLESLQKMVAAMADVPEPPADGWIDNQPAPYQHTEEVEQVGRDTDRITHFIGGKKAFHEDIPRPDRDLREFDPEAYHESKKKAYEATSAARERTRKQIHDRIDAVSASQRPDRLRDMVLDSDSPPEALEELAGQLICGDCGKAFTTEKALRGHYMGAGHGTFAEGMPHWEQSVPYRRQQKKAADEAGQDDGAAEDKGTTE